MTAHNHIIFQITIVAFLAAFLTFIPGCGGDETEAIRLDPKHAAAYNNRGAAYGEKGEYDKAIADYTEAIRLYPKHANAYCNRGVAYGEKGEYDKKIADLTEAIRLDPKYAAAYYNRGVAYRWKGEYDKAIADYTEAIRLEPTNDLYRKNLKDAKTLKGGR